MYCKWILKYPLFIQIEVVVKSISKIEPLVASNISESDNDHHWYLRMWHRPPVISEEKKWQWPPAMKDRY